MGWVLPNNNLSWQLEKNFVESMALVTSIYTSIKILVGREESFSFRLDGCSSSDHNGFILKCPRTLATSVHLSKRYWYLLKLQELLGHFSLQTTGPGLWSSEKRTIRMTLLERQASFEARSTFLLKEGCFLYVVFAPITNVQNIYGRYLATFQPVTTNIYKQGAWSKQETPSPALAKTPFFST